MDFIPGGNPMLAPWELGLNGTVITAIYIFGTKSSNHK